MVLDKVTINIDVLGLIVEEIIMSNMNWTLVIIVNMSAGGSGHS